MNAPTSFNKEPVASALPKITVVTPVYNCVQYIEETLVSVLMQDYPALEYIVVDGGSTDGSLEIVRRYEANNNLRHCIAQVISGPDQGMYDAIGKGFDHATGDVFCYLNADDLFEAGGLLAVGEYFARYKNVQVVYHEDLVLVDGWKYPNVKQPDGVSTADLLNKHILFQDGVFFRRCAYEAIGGVRRDLRLAGDFDLWLRMSARVPFTKRDGHVSCFRMRPEQLSSQHDRYYQEVDRSIKAFLVCEPLQVRTWLKIRSTLLAVYRKIKHKQKLDRLLFPIDFGNLPPPKAAFPAGSTERAVSPVDGLPTDRFLFTSPDTRFGDGALNYIYLDERHGIAISHPRMYDELLDTLYRKNYSSPPTRLRFPVGASPYKRFDRRRFWERALLLLPIGSLSRVLFPNAWLDNTFEELTTVLQASGVDTTQPIRFLDTGCFEGQLLDRVGEKTCWEAWGLELNSQAAKVATDKGHRVWCGRAENAIALIPQDQRFDVIYLGQSIEHLIDPVSALSQLRNLLAPNGVLVASTPSLDSREIDWFGPTWAHWHPPYHRFIFSKKGLCALAQRTEFKPIHFQTFSHPYWTAMSLSQNGLGLGGAVSHSIDFGSEIVQEAQRIDFWKRIVWNRQGKGDYCYIALKSCPSAPIQNMRSTSDALAKDAKPPSRLFQLLRFFGRPIYLKLRPRVGLLRQHSPRNLKLPHSPIEADPHTRRVDTRISIVTPSFNQSNFIERTMKSVINQHYSNLEYFVQDGQSTDGTIRILHDYSHRLTGWESVPDSGQAQAINTGFSRTSGEIMSWLNSDDILLPGSLAFVASYFESHPDVDVIYGHRILIDEEEREIGRWIVPAHDNEILSWADFVPQETLFWRRHIWDRVGGRLDENYQFALDWDLLVRFREAGARFARVDRFLGGFRIHPEQKTSANMSDIGLHEMRRIRTRTLGYSPEKAQVDRVIRNYLLKHLLGEWCLRLLHWLRLL